MVSVCISWTCFVLLLSFFFCFLCLISSVVRKLIVAFLSVFRSMRSTVRIDEEERIWAVDWLIATSSIELIDLLLVAIIPLDSLLAGSHFFVFFRFPFSYFDLIFTSLRFYVLVVYTLSTFLSRCRFSRVSCFLLRFPLLSVCLFFAIESDQITISCFAKFVQTSKCLFFSFKCSFESIGTWGGSGQLMELHWIISSHDCRFGRSHPPAPADDTVVGFVGFCNRSHWTRH